MQVGIQNSNTNGQILTCCLCFLPTIIRGEESVMGFGIRSFYLNFVLDLNLFCFSSIFLDNTLL